MEFGKVNFTTQPINYIFKYIFTFTCHVSIVGSGGNNNKHAGHGLLLYLLFRFTLSICQLE